MTNSKIGPHINKVYSKQKDLYSNIIVAILNAKNEIDFTISAIQIFIAGPRSYKINLKEEEEIKKIGKLELNIYVHNTYISNPWSYSSLIRNKALNSINKQLEIANKINAKGFIIHFPKSDINLILSNLYHLINYKFSGKIFFEIPSISKKYSVFHNVNILNNLYDRIKKEIDHNMEYFGLCIDTAHLWSCGVDISDYENTKKWLYKLTINHKNILFHVNDNTKKLGEAPDIHASLTEGSIWKKYKNNLKNSGLYAILEYAKKYNIDIILERKVVNTLNNDYYIINKLYNIILYNK